MGKNKRNIWHIVVTLLGIFWLCHCTAFAKATKSPPTKAPVEKTEFGTPMEFTILRLSSNLCEPNCPEWIAAEGEITDQTPAKLTKLLSNTDYRKLPLVLNSGGGRVIAAMAMGRLVRKYRMNTAIARSSSTDCSTLQAAASHCPPDTAVHAGYVLSRAQCNSACPLILLGGVTRIADSGAYLGLHQPHGETHPYVDHYWDTWRMIHGKKVIISHRFIKRTYEKPREVVGVTPQLKPQYLQYFKEMGGSPEILVEMDKASPKNLNEIPFVFGVGPREKLGLVTDEKLNMADLISTDHCKSASALSSNCVFIKDFAPVVAQTSGTPCYIASGCGKPSSPLQQSSPITPESDMTFTVMQSETGKCQPRCPQWIAAMGHITRNTPLKLLSVLADPEKRKLPILVQSHGGDFDASLALAHVIFKYEMNTAVAMSSLTGKAPHEGSAKAQGSYCTGTCPIVVMAGDVRIIQDEANIGVDPLPADKRVPFEEFLIEAHRSFGIVRAMDLAGPNGYTLQSRYDIFTRTGLTTDPKLNLDYLIGPDHCKTYGKLSSNCVEVGKAKEPQTAAAP